MPSKAKRSTPVQSQVWVAQPSDDDIRFRAYEIYVARGEQPGRDVDDWLQAERELGLPVEPAALGQNGH